MPANKRNHYPSKKVVFIFATAFKEKSMLFHLKVSVLINL